MKVSVQDPDVLKALQPSQVATYLQANGWQEYSKIDDKAIVWIQRTASGQEFDLELPLKPEFRDFARRMSEVLETLETAEERSQLEILSDITNSWADIVRLYVNHPDATNGSLPLEDSINFLQRVRDMMAWVAYSAVAQKAYFQEPIPNLVVDYLQQLRIGQTEWEDAYIFTIISPIFSGENDVNGASEPFERKVIKALAQALETIRVSAEEALTIENLSPFVSTEQQGVSANLCEALVEMNDICGGRGLEINLSWSPLLSIPIELPRQIVLTPNTMAVLREVKELGKKFKVNWEKEVGTTQEGWRKLMENVESQSDNAPLALSAAYPIRGANQPIQLYEGQLEVTKGEVTEQGSGTVSFVWLPYPHFEFQLLQQNELSQDIRGKSFLKLHTLNNVVAEAEILEISYEFGELITTKMLGRLLESIVIESSHTLSYVMFHLANFHFFRGSRVVSLDQERMWYGRVIFEAEGWRVTVDNLQEINNLVHDLHSLSGYAVTHVGKLERVDRKDFTAKEANDFLEALYYFLSFARGLWSCPILPVGYDASGNPVRREWNPQKVRVDRWQDEEQEVYSWFRFNIPESLVKIFPGFMRQWQDCSVSLARTIHWYVESNKQTGGVEGSLILTQAALELLAWVLLVEQGRVREDDFRCLNSASRKINRLLSEFNIPSQIPENLTSLTEFECQLPHSQNNGPYACSEVRNLIIHSNPENRQRLQDISDKTIMEAWELGLWYVELILLHLFNYQEVYVNRILRSSSLETVPWASMKS